MTRKIRNYAISKTYHIIIKGIDDQNIFYDVQDRRVFLKYVSITKKEYNYNIFSYSLMDNHVHMVIRSEKEFLSKAMQSLQVRYIQYFNKKYKRTGSLVQNRFRSKIVENQKYFLEVCKYVHRNPENAGIAKTEDYEWSSYKEYLGKGKLVDKRILMHYFDNDINKFIEYTRKSNVIEELKELAEYEIMRKLTDKEVENIISKIFEIKEVFEIPYFFKNLTKTGLEDAVKKLKEIKGSNKTQIARIIRINRSVIERIWDKLNWKKGRFLFCAKKEPTLFYVLAASSSVTTATATDY